MSKKNHFISNKLSKETKFLEEVTLATSRLFESKSLEVLFSSKKREIKAYRDDENMVIYILDRKDKEITVSLHDFHDFNKDKNIKEIIAWQYKEKNGIIENDLYMHTIISCNLNKKLDKEQILPQTEKEFESIISKSFTTEKDKLNMQEMITHLKKIFGENYVSNKDFINGLIGNKEIECSMDVGVIKQYTEVLNSKGYMNTQYPNEFFIDLNKEAIPQYQKMLADWTFGMNGMIKACEENHYNTYKKSFEYNDLDNNVWIKANSLIVSSQNVGFYFDIKDDNNFKVYLLEKEYKSIDKEIKRIETALKNNNIDELKDVILKVENGDIKNINYSLIYAFELDMQFSVEAMKRENVFKSQYPVDITTYQYQKDYHAHVYGMSEFEFIAQAMMTLGGGFDYDENLGSFVGSVKYIPNLPKASNTRDKKFTDLNYLYPKKISNLNKDWLEALKYAVEVLKKDMPKPIVFEGDSEEDSLKKAIKYFSIKISKLEEKEDKPKF